MRKVTATGSSISVWVDEAKAWQEVLDIAPLPVQEPRRSIIKRLLLSTAIQEAYGLSAEK